jgi:hypothetical protein
MATVMAAIVRSGHTFSGSAAARVVDDVGGGRDGVPRPFVCRVVMIEHTRASGHFSTVGPVGQWQAVSPAVNARDAQGSRERGSPRSINCGREMRILTSPLSLCSLCLCFLPGRALPRPRSRLLRSRVAAFPASIFRSQWLRLSQS